MKTNTSTSHITREESGELANLRKQDLNVLSDLEKARFALLENLEKPGLSNREEIFDRHKEEQNYIFC